MADNSHPPPGPPPDDEPTPPRGELIFPPSRPPAQPPSQPPAPRQPSEPAPVDPEEFRQFQEFKQFQELMRQQKEQGFPQGPPPPPGSLQPWGPPPPRQNPVKRALRAIAGKIVTAVIVVLLLVAAGYLAIDYFLGDAPSQPTASERGGRKQEGTLLFEENPRAAVRWVYDDVAQGDPERACGRFTVKARDQFAENFSAYGNTCEEAVAGLNAEVVPGQKSEYANPSEMNSVDRYPTTDSVTVSSCTLGVRGGPPLGQLTVTRDRNSKGGNQWIVTAHESEDCTTVPSAPPTS